MKIMIQGRDYTDILAKHWGWFVFWGLCLVLLGTGAIYASVFTTLASVIFLGIVFCVASVFMLINTFKFWLHKGISFFGHLLLSILYFIAGVMLLVTPLQSAISLTLLLGIFFIAVGIYRIIFSLYAKLPRWGWILLSGIITTILGVLILAQWPSSGLYVIGLFVGIDILLIGWSYIMLGLFSRTAAKK